MSARQLPLQGVPGRSRRPSLSGIRADWTQRSSAARRGLVRGLNYRHLERSVCMSAHVAVQECVDGLGEQL